MDFYLKGEHLYVLQVYTTYTHRRHFSPSMNRHLHALYSILMLRMAQISDVKHVLEQFLDKSVIGFNSSDDNARDNEKTDEMRPLVHGEEGGGGEWRNENSDSKYFRLCTIKDRYCAAAEWSCDGG